MRIPILANWFASEPSGRAKLSSRLRIGIPRALNVWSTHQFWVGLFTAIGIEPRDIVFSSETSEQQYREYGQGRGTVDCCYPVKCLVGHYGELLYGQKRKIDILFSPMIYSLPSFLRDSVTDNLACPRVMAAPENVRAGFLREKDVFAELGVRHIAPLVSLAEPRLVPKQLYEALALIKPGITRREVAQAVEEAYTSLKAFDRQLRAKSREILTKSALANKPCILVLARPYHMDSGIGHNVETELQAYGYPILWGQHLPLDADILDWLFGEQITTGAIRSPIDISDVWRSSYSANTNEILWAAKFGARMPWIACVLRLSSYECGMDQPTYTPVQAIVESSGTLFFSFQDLDSTKPVSSVKIRIETIAYYLQQYASTICTRKLAGLPIQSPFAARPADQLTIKDHTARSSPPIDVSAPGESKHCNTFPLRAKVVR